MTLTLLDFYPSFGADLLIAILGGVLSLLAAYIVYVISVRRTRKDRLKYVVSLIGAIAPSARNQAGYCRKYAELIAANPFSNKLLQLEANSDPKRMADKVDQEGVYHAYLWKYKRTDQTYRDFHRLYAYIDYIDFLIDNLLRTNENIKNAVWERKKQYRLTFGTMMRAMRSIALTEELKKEQPELVQFVLGLDEALAAENSEDENLVASYKIVVQPLYSYITQKAKTHPKVTETFFLVQDLINEYHGIELAAKHNAEDYAYYADKLEKTAGDLLAASEGLRKDFHIGEG